MKPSDRSQREAIRVEGESLVAEVEPEWRTLGRYGRQNLLATFAQVVGWGALLSVCDAQRLPLGVRALGVVAFCLMMQGVFTMLHEYCHKNAHRDPRLNYLIGWIASTLFGTTPTFLRVQHWGHHRRNRSAAERAEFVHYGEVAWRKSVQYYAAILGGIWLGCFLAPLLAPLLPHRVATRLSRHERFNSFAAAFAEFSARDWRTLQVEGLGSLAFWSALLAFGPWRLSTLVIAYAAFAFSWSSLQWIYHMNTPVHVIEGAYNLRVPLPVRALFLNFNYNLTHHRSPATPWQELHRKSDLRETQPIWYRYLLIFRPPRPFPADLSVLEKRYF